MPVFDFWWTLPTHKWLWSACQTPFIKNKCKRTLTVSVDIFLFPHRHSNHQHRHHTMPVDPRTACLQSSAYSFFMKARGVALWTSSLCCPYPIASTTVFPQNRVQSETQSYLKCGKQEIYFIEITKIFFHAVLTLPRFPILWLMRNSGELICKRNWTSAHSIKMTLWETHKIRKSKRLRRQKI